MWLEILQDIIIMCKKFTTTTKRFTISYTLTIYLAFYETEEWNYHQCTYNSKIKDKKKAAKYSPLGLFLNFGRNWLKWLYAMPTNYPSHQKMISKSYHTSRIFSWFQNSYHQVLWMFFALYLHFNAFSHKNFRPLWDFWLLGLAFCYLGFLHGKVFTGN